MEVQKNSTRKKSGKQKKKSLRKRSKRGQKNDDRDDDESTGSRAIGMHCKRVNPDKTPDVLLADPQMTHFPPKTIMRRINQVITLIKILMTIKGNPT